MSTAASSSLPVNYAKQHAVLALLTSLIESLLLERPDDPLDYLLDELSSGRISAEKKKLTSLIESLLLERPDDPLVYLLDELSSGRISAATAQRYFSTTSTSAHVAGGQETDGHQQHLHHNNDVHAAPPPPGSNSTSDDANAVKPAAAATSHQVERTHISSNSSSGHTEAKHIPAENKEDTSHNVQGEEVDKPSAAAVNVVNGGDDVDGAGVAAEEPLGGGAGQDGDNAAADAEAAEAVVDDEKEGADE
ncbi:Hypothetical protein, putative [Bodo saltans]|uniref:Uncharacterized protein n=1 Tax=Bodo saltans TaxID=75058 RepID=A0A0S4IXQ2_BODSA|nr:Hypothetical protein, putative [Bodo saltans]|eukprot:CUG06813.1 Hypothetical protein, putative [Bodo saltans]